MLDIFSVCDDSIQVLNMHVSDWKAERIHLNTMRRHEWYNMCRNNAYIFRAPHYILNRSFVMCKFVDDIWQKADNFPQMLFFPPGQLRPRFGYDLVVGLFVWLCYTCFTQDQEPGPDSIWRCHIYSYWINSHIYPLSGYSGVYKTAFLLIPNFDFMIHMQLTTTYLFICVLSYIHTYMYIVKVMVSVSTSTLNWT